ncbi:alpha/beta fold hydrolase [Fulvivirga lutimaris]|uniref:alpha/beta fold hydrolase n=1 Tax=Fulvivirga lutimaris TaxID=1819566 RepID=UPI0012BC93DD|nr:alpha/beta hydrolase [Fulvivirga lutimaris]MTI41092.1 alpha/beta hydrolase [Fulvivirga lutimaris]
MNNSIKLAFGILVMISIACTGNKEKEVSSITTHIAVENKGIPIDYKESGDGNYTLIFIHGWCINDSYWTHQVDALKSDYKIITLNLPGFNGTDTTRNDWSIEAYASDVNALIEQLQLKNVVLIGHSMGGEIILETALYNKNVIALIGIDNFKDMGHEMSEEMQEGINEFFALLESNYKEISKAFAESNLFSNSTDSLVRARVIADFQSADSIVAIASLKNLFDYSFDEMSKLEKLNQKLYLINSNTSPTNLDPMINAGVKCELFEIDSAGHYPMIENPQEFNSLLAQVLNKIINE